MKDGSCEEDVVGDWLTSEGIEEGVGVGVGIVKYHEES